MNAGRPTPPPVGVLLLTFGSAVTSADVPAYLRSVRGGREPSDELIAEFSRRFDLIGRSPLIDITLEQAAALQRALVERDGAGSFQVAAGMLHSAPRVEDSLRALVDGGAATVIAIVLAPQYSPLILSGYQRTSTAARLRLPPASRCASPARGTSSRRGSTPCPARCALPWTHSQRPVATVSASCSPRTACPDRWSSAIPAT